MTEFGITATFRISEDITLRAGHLLAEMERINARSDQWEVEALPRRHAIETLAIELIADARHACHPLAARPARFWPAWVGFLQRHSAN